MKSKKVLPLISLLFVAIMLFSVGMIAKEHRERQQDIKGFVYGLTTSLFLDIICLVDAISA